MLFSALVNNPQKNPNIGFMERFSYGLGDFASQLLCTPAGAILIYYYTEVVNVNIAIVATLILVSRFLDGLSDLFVGWLIENTKSPYGKARAWVLRMILPFFVATVALFTVPAGMSDIFKYIYIFVSYNFAITVVYTAINLPYGAMTTSMTNDSYQRSILVIYRMLLATVGGTLTMVVTFPMVEFFGNDQTAWTITFMILGALACFCFFLTFAFCHERIVTPPPAKSDLKTALIVIKGLFKNKYWLMLTGAMLATSTGDMVSGYANTYYCRYFLEDPNLIGAFATIGNSFKIGAMIIILPIMLKKMGKNNSLIFACAIIVVGYLLRLIDPYNANIAYLAAAVVGFGQGFTYACLFAMLPDCVEYGEYIDHERHDGMVYSGASFGMKLAAGLSAILASSVMQFGGYVNGATEQTAEAINTILIATTVLPAGLFILGIVSVLGYKLDKIYPEVIKELQRRKVEGDPLAPNYKAPAAEANTQA